MKVNSRVLSLIALATISLTLTACGQSLSGALTHNTNSSNSDSSSGSGNGAKPTDPWTSVDTSGSAENIFGKQSFTIDPVAGMLKVSFDLPVNIFGIGVTIPIPEIPGASVAIEVNASTGKWMLTFNIPLSKLVHGIGIVGPKTLPNGDDLPGVPGGEPPRLASHVVKSNVDLYIYGSVKYFALFVPAAKLNKYMLLDLVFPIKNKDKTKILGYFATVTPKRGYDGGLFISIVFPPELSALLDQIF